MIIVVGIPAVLFLSYFYAPGLWAAIVSAMLWLLIMLVIQIGSELRLGRSK